MMILLTILAGALHVLSPDHWLPTSVLAWQKGWRPTKTLIFSIGLFFSHVLTGYFLYLLFKKWSDGLDQLRLFYVSLLFVILVTLVRSVRLSKVKTVFRIGHQGIRGNFLAWSLLGPSEILVPIFVKSKDLGMGYLAPFGAFLVGTGIAGTLLVLLSQSWWNRPFGLPLGVHWVFRRRAVLPALAGVTVSLSLLLLF